MSPITVFADTIRSDDGYIVEPIFLDIHFSGIVALRPPTSRVPIQVIIKLPDEFTGQLYPIVGGESALPRDKLQHKYAGLRPPTNMFPFFPLIRCFDHQNGQHWRCLLDEIQCTLLQFARNVDRNYYDLMQDLFWMVFVATYPSFPGGEWDAWDVRINMDSTFITTWLGDHGLQQLRDSQTPNAAHRFIFDELKEIVEYFFCISISSSL